MQSYETTFADLIGRGNIGRSIEVDATAGHPAVFQSTPLLEVRIKNENPVPLTITVDSVFPLDNGILATAFLGFAKIEWGNGGASTFAEIDFIRGQTFSVLASYVRVTAFHANQLPGRLLAFCAPGSRGILPPTRTININPLAVIAAGANSAEFEVPPFAKRWKYMVEVNLVATAFSPLGIEFRNNFTTGPGATVGLVPFNYGGTVRNYIDEGRVPTEARVFRIQNGSLANLPIGQQVQFDLSL